MTMRNKAQKAMAIGWGSVFVLCVGAIFFPDSRIIGIIGAILWGVAIILQSTHRRKRKQRAGKISN